MQFKIGDEVKLISFPYHKMIGKIGVVIEVRSFGRDFPYRIRIDNFFNPAVLEHEIEKVPTKNQQLIFEFMRQDYDY